MPCYVSQSANALCLKRQALMSNDNENTKVVYVFVAKLF